MFRVSRDRLVGDADTIEGAREIVRGQPVVRYDVDEIGHDPYTCGHFEFESQQLRQEVFFGREFIVRQNGNIAGRMDILVAIVCPRLHTSVQRT
jgi:hypothetical protein